MLLTPHTIVGVAVATTIPNVFISVPLAFLLHFVGDKLPHWDFFSGTSGDDRKKRQGWRVMAVMADLGLGIWVGLTFTYFALWGLNDTTLALNVFLCAIASVLPDALTGPSIYLKDAPEIFGKIRAIQSKVQTQAPFLFGMFTQIVVVLISLFLISRSIG